LGGKRSYSQFPNNPDYALGPITNSICDTVTSIDETLSQKTSSISIYYHSSWQTAFINASGLKGSQLKLIVMDISGRVVYSDIGVSTNGYFTHDLPMDNFASGLYLITIVSEKEKLTGKMVKP
ncbi:MAG: T9SS type A sorting domain-containing protein, partial [Bacteroidia bacterium]|nr:T9SS type A sorting domain-containing protein [Bacteroidia bacterium]